MRSEARQGVPGVMKRFSDIPACRFVERKRVAVHPRDPLAPPKYDTAAPGDLTLGELAMMQARIAVVLHQQQRVEQR